MQQIEGQKVRRQGEGGGALERRVTGMGSLCVMEERQLMLDGLFQLLKAIFHRVDGALDQRFVFGIRFGGWGFALWG